MSNFETNRTPWILVGLSMTMLFLFVGYWNYSTYVKERTQLADNVKVQLQLAYTEVKDSELVFFIKTQLSDTITGSSFPDSVSIYLDNHPMFPTLQRFKGKKTIGKLEADQKTPDTTIVLDFTLDAENNSELDRRLKSEIKVLATSQLSTIEIDQYPDLITGDTSTQITLLSDTFDLPNWMSNSDNDSSVFATRFNIDTSELGLKSLYFNRTGSGGEHSSIDKTFERFKEKLIENDLPTDFERVTDLNSAVNGLRIHYDTNGFTFRDWIIDLVHYRWYVINKMLPTILFSIFLLGIIALAFWTLITNWIKQNKLVIEKNEFINNMTHELKTPLATVGVALEEISKFDLNTDQQKTREYVDISRKEVSKLSMLVDKVLNLASFDSTSKILSHELVDLNAIVSDNIASFKLQLEEKNAEVDYTNTLDKPFISGDTLHMSNAVHNIMDNAIKYSGNGLKLRILIRELNNKISLSFQDNGQGIPKEYHDKIFDRFFRMPTDDRHDVKGHGLGLNYVKNIVESMKGEITIESKINEGSTFTLTFPKTVSDV